MLSSGLCCDICTDVHYNGLNRDVYWKEKITLDIIMFLFIVALIVRYIWEANNFNK